MRNAKSQIAAGAVICLSGKALTDVETDNTYKVHREVDHDNSKDP